jgi:hypothetical protein
MKKLPLIAAFLFVLTDVSISSQESSKISKTPAPRDMILKVSQFGQFVKRFNYEEDFWGNPIAKPFSDKISRKDYLGLLFDNKDERLDSTSKIFSLPYEILKNEFVKNVTGKNYKINRASDSLYTLSVCEVTYKNKPGLTYLVMKQELINKGIAWVITDVAADFIFDEDNNSSFEKFIPPTSNEVNYIHLKNLFERRDSLACYAYKGYTCNRLSIFFHLLHNGEIQFKFVKLVTYFIYDVPGWLIQVQEYNREGTNSGWLIKDITKSKKPVKDYMRSAVNLEK